MRSTLQKLAKSIPPSTRRRIPSKVGDNLSLEHFLMRGKATSLYRNFVRATRGKSFFLSFHRENSRHSKRHADHRSYYSIQWKIYLIRKLGERPFNGIDPISRGVGMKSIWQVSKKTKSDFSLLFKFPISALCLSVVDFFLVVLLPFPLTFWSSTLSFFWTSSRTLPFYLSSPLSLLSRTGKDQRSTDPRTKAVENDARSNATLWKGCGRFSTTSRR